MVIEAAIVSNKEKGQPWLVQGVPRQVSARFVAMAHMKGQTASEALVPLMEKYIEEAWNGLSSSKQ